MNKIIEEKKLDLLKILNQHRIKEAFVFGSAVGENFKEASDIDLLVRFEEVPFDGYAENLWDLEDKVEALFQRKVDIVPEHTLKNPFFIKHLQKNRVKIYG
jgi:uncharacterized protein